jgi:hypothetical protein
MNKPQVSSGRLVVLLISLALFALLVAVASAHGTAAAPSDPTDGSIVPAAPDHVTVHFDEELDTHGGSTIWMVEALAGVLVVVGLSETLRRCYREPSVPDREMNS